MAVSHPERHWDATAEENKWRRALESGRTALVQFGEQLSKGSPDFYILCLAELDAGNKLLRSECFLSRATFLSEVRKLIIEPTEPSSAVPSVEAYRASQKWWLESILQQYGFES